MVKKLPGERFIELDYESSLRFRYAVSNLGRLVSFTNKIEDGNELKCGRVKGYRVHGYRVIEKKKVKYVHNRIGRMVAKHFLKPKSSEHIYVIHLDHDKTNDHYKNLKWVTETECRKHQSQSPGTLAALKQLHLNNKKRLYKLSEAKVRAIKKRLANTKKAVKLKDLALEFGVSDMQIYRIKSGENWSHITV